MADYLVREEDGTSRIILEEGGGFILLESNIAYDRTTSDTGVTSSDSLVRLKRFGRGITDTGMTFSDTLVAPSQVVVTQEVAEALILTEPALVVTQEVAEVLIIPEPALVVTSEVVEVLVPITAPGFNIFTTQVATEVLYLDYIPGRVTQVATEVLWTEPVPGRISQLAIEVLREFTPNDPLPSMSLRFRARS